MDRKCGMVEKYTLFVCIIHKISVFAHRCYAPGSSFHARYDTVSSAISIFKYIVITYNTIFPNLSMLLARAATT